MRKLATIRKINDIRPIPGADKIEVAQVDGWECVISKTDGFHIGDKIIYIEIDSIVPDKPEFEFLRSRKFRVRTIKLRGQVSQGLVVPLTILPIQYLSNNKCDFDDDVTEVLGIKKYDPQAEQEQKMLDKCSSNKTKAWYPKFLMRFNWFRRLIIKHKSDDFPSWIVKTDEERIQNKTTMFNVEKELGTIFSVTEKIDGQSATYFLKRIKKNKFEFGVCSRNLQILTPNNSSYWIIAKQCNIEKCLKSLIGDDDRIVLQGEIIGEGIQGNKYKVSGYDFYAFNLIGQKGKHTTEEITNTLSLYGIKTVPIVDIDFKLKNSISEMVEYAKGKSVLVPDQNREGVVIRSYDKNISFKVINPDFLLAEKD